MPITPGHFSKASAAELKLGFLSDIRSDLHNPRIAGLKSLAIPCAMYFSQ